MSVDAADLVAVRTCGRCGETKPLDLFTWNYKKGMRAGRSTQCGRCRSGDSDAWKTRRLDQERRLGATSRTCNSCKLDKPLDAFSPRVWSCKRCRQQSARDFTKNNPDALRRRQLWDRYKMTPEDYDRLLTVQNGVCACCRKPPGVRRLHVDHDHACCPTSRTCGKCVRGLLCNVCNVRLSVLESQSIEYVRLRAYLGVTVVKP